MPIRRMMKADLLVAMKTQQPDKVSVLRTLIAAIDNAEAVPLSVSAEQQAVGYNAVGYNNGRTNDVPRKLLSAEDIQFILQKELDNRKANLRTYLRLGKEAEALRMQKEVELIEHYQKESIK